MTATKAFYFGLAGAIFFISSCILGGLLFPGYSHISQLISESYATGTAYGPQLRYFGFIPSGIFIAVFAFLAIRTLPKSSMTSIGFSAIGIFYGLATILVSLFPCDKGCDNQLAGPSVSQLIHNLAGGLTYMTVPAGLILLGIAARKWPNAKQVSSLGITCGIISMLFVGILSPDLHSGFAGLYQRIIEGSILLWIVVCSFYLRGFQKG